MDELSPHEKDECKILISDYLNNPDLNKIFPAKNVNQLQYVVDFLIDYINNKERIYREKMGESLQGNILKIKSSESEEEKIQENLVESESPKQLLGNESSIKNQLNEKYRKEDTYKLSEKFEQVNMNPNSNLYKKSENRKNYSANNIRVSNK
jgi:hypothetical protein